MALELVEQAGKLVANAIEDRDKKIAEKASPTDLVTETDKGVEDLLVAGLKYVLFLQFFEWKILMQLLFAF